MCGFVIQNWELAAASDIVTREWESSVLLIEQQLSKLHFSTKHQHFDGKTDKELNLAKDFVVLSKFLVAIRAERLSNSTSKPNYREITLFRTLTAALQV
jgi:hypothetical protein